MGKYSAGTVMGQFSIQEATRRCIKELAAKGIPAFVDKRGREWSPEAYVAMDMRSTLGNTARAAQWSRCDEYGIKLIAVSSHLGARPGCAPYQGHIYSLDGSYGTTTDGSGRSIAYVPLSDTSYGKPDGLFGINCGHVQYPFMPGVNFQRYFPYPKTENDEMYRNHQKQRYYERQIRTAKRECVMLNEIGDKEGFNKAAAKLKRSKESYKKFTESKGLYLHNDRTQVVGFDRSVSSKATWANRKAEMAKAQAAAIKAGNVPGGGKGLGDSGGHAVTVNAPKPDVVGNTNVIYKDTKTGLTDREKYGKINLTTNPVKDKKYKIKTDSTVNIGTDPAFPVEGTSFKSKEYFESREYKEKFDQIPGLTILSRKSVYNCAKSAVLDNYGVEAETGMIIGRLFGNVSARESHEGLNMKISVPKGRANQFIFVHNHPNNGPISIDDILAINACPEIKTMVAASHDGRVFWLEIGEGTRFDITPQMIDSNSIEVIGIQNDWARTVHDNGGDFFKSFISYANKYNWKVGIIE